MELLYSESKTEELQIIGNLMINTKKKNITSDYKIVAQLGRGANGICYKGVSRVETSKERCIKRIKKTTKNQGQTVLAQEICYLDQLTHPNIVRLYDVYEDQSSFYLVMDLCEGGELFDYLDQKGVFSEHEAKEIFVQMISAIRYCHEKKIAHRDLKPQNFLIEQTVNSSQTPKLKLIDFNLSFQWQNDMMKQILAKQGKRIVGTPYYTAPEVLKGKYDYRCDIWSAGVILYMLVTGVPPFNGNSPNQIFKQIQKKAPKFDTPQMEEVSLLLKDLIAKMLSPVESRISIPEIFLHPWMKIEPKKTKIPINYHSLIEYSKFSKLKQIAANYLALQMTTKQLKVYEELFQNLDQNKDGFISVQELKANLGENGAGNGEVAGLLEFFEVDSQGMMSYSDFVASFIQDKMIKCRKNLEYVFQKMDTNGDGVVSRQQLDSALKRHNMRKKALKPINLNEDTNKIFTAADKNNDGLIDFEQFAAVICNQIEL